MGNTIKIRLGAATVLLDLERAERDLLLRREALQLIYQGKDPRITNDVIKAAAQRVYGLNAVQTSRMIELRQPSLKTLENVRELAETFCSYVDDVLATRGRQTTPSSSVKHEPLPG